MSSYHTKKLFIGGAGKSGTTFLFSCLGQHPLIIPAQPKESSFFLDQSHPLLNVKNNIHQRGNHDFFFSDHQGIHLDGTAHLLYQKEMPAVFSKMKNVKIIFILRHPAKRIYSSFQFVKHNLAHFKKEVTFSEYVTALLDGKTDLIQSWLRTKGSQYVLAKELKISTYYQHIQQWERTIGRENLYLLTFKELTTQTKMQLAKITNWLELEQFEFQMKAKNDQNTSYQVRSWWLHYQTTQLAKLIPKSRLYESLKRFYFYASKINKSTSYTREDAEALQKLTLYFQVFNKQLESVIDLNIQHWTN